MKKRSLLIGLLLAGTVALTACGGNDAPVSNTEASTVSTESSMVVGTELPEETETAIEIITDEIAPEGMVVNELSGEFIDEELKYQRPIAVMLDNEITAFKNNEGYGHYGLSQADVVYEMVNSTDNNRITRLMALFKDWESVDRIGSVRSARVTNCVLCMEWNAVMCHDGGPFYINAYTALPYLDNLSGGFDRISNGKSKEFTEYITEDDNLRKRLKANNIETQYNNYYEGEHFIFANDVDLGDVDTVNKIELPFPHNASTLEYDEEEQLYFYSEYGKAHTDLGNDGEPLGFKNVIIYSADMYPCTNGEYVDTHGYMYYDIIEKKGEGYYIVNGKIEPITWKKITATSPTKFYDADDNEIILNVGKTYIGIVPSDTWDELVLE